MSKTLTVLLLLALCAIPLPVSAAGSETGSWGWIETVGRWFNLALLVGFLVYVMRRPIRAFFETRRREIKHEMASAERALEEAGKQLAEVEARMKHLDDELADLRKRALKEAEVEKSRILEEAERDSRRIVAAAEREIQGMTRSAQARLRKLAAELAVDLAARKLSSEMDEDVQQRIVDQFLQELVAGQKDKA